MTEAGNSISCRNTRKTDVASIALESAWEGFRVAGNDFGGKRED